MSFFKKCIKTLIKNGGKGTLIQDYASDNIIAIYFKQTSQSDPFSKSVSVVSGTSSLSPVSSTGASSATALLKQMRKEKI